LHAPIADLIGLWMERNLSSTSPVVSDFSGHKKILEDFYTPSRPIPSLCATVAKAGAASNWCRQFMNHHAPGGQ